ncbi:IS1634 family transposase [Virgibacillus sp. YIM 98842]|jgi:transposase|uniref:IS1634 family transposase n=1 Tax=Virgibacillus sp. YIM 98842 TaxID=2663533 RepID=UPI0013D9019F|nr:IS1634 family transposase [Virgibacillus sp. YIM 98842]
MRIKKSVSKNSVSYSVIENVRDINGKSTTKVVEALGNEQEILERHPGVDPEEWARAYAKKLTEEKKMKSETILIKHNPKKSISKGEKRSFNVGYLFLKSIYYQLKLDKICKEISDRYNITYDLNKILALLIYMRVIHPTSKKGTLEKADDLLESHSVETQHIYRALDILAEESDNIEKTVYKNSTAIVERKTELLYYDCTNFYFEIEDEEGLKQYGMSKENRPNPIVQMGLFMDGSGLPLAFVINPGNQNEQPTLKPLEKRILKDFHLSKFVVCTDAGLSSHENRLYNSMNKRAFVTTQSIKKLKKHLKEWALDPSGWKVVDSTQKVATKKRKQTINLNDLDLEKDKQVYHKERWINENGLEQKLVVTFSPKHKRYQAGIREKQIDRALKKVDNPSRMEKKRANSPDRFIQSTHVTEDGEIAGKSKYTINSALVDEEAKFDGFYGVCTNLESTPGEIVKINQRRWEIEETFRILKSEMRTRPVFLQKDERIKAHFLVCFLSLLTYRLIEKKIDESATCFEIIQTLREMRVLKATNEGYIPTYTRTDLTDKLHDVFGFRTDTEIVPIQKMKKILKEVKKHK